MTSDGTNIIQSVQILRAFWEEAEAFKEELLDVLQSPGVPTSTIKFIEEIEDAVNSSYHDVAGWVYDGWHWSFRANDNKSGPGKKKIAGQLSVLVDIGGEWRPARSLGFPCIVVAWAHGPGADWKVEFQELWPAEAAAATIISECLFVQKGSDTSGPMKTAHWFYILPLTSVGDPRAMQRLLVKPVFDLIAGRPIEATFADTPEVLRFSKRGEAVGLLPL